MLWRFSVARHHDGAVRGGGKIAAHGLELVVRTDHPATAVEIDDHAPESFPRYEDAQLDLTAVDL
ncbi:hypothetical protein D3C84_1107440 [compost metagenome]